MDNNDGSEQKNEYVNSTRGEKVRIRKCIPSEDPNRNLELISISICIYYMKGFVPGRFSREGFYYKPGLYTFSPRCGSVFNFGGIIPHFYLLFGILKFWGYIQVLTKVGNSITWYELFTFTKWSPRRSTHREKLKYVVGGGKV